MEPGTKRVAGQHVRAQAKARSWKRFFGGSLKRDYDSWAQGAEGEEVVGRILEGLRERGWCVIHDVSFGRGNIDHIVVGPGGIFTIETKSRGGKVWPDHLDEKMLNQAYAEKKSLEKITMLEVQALLVFSRAYIVGKSIARRRGVVVLSSRSLAWFFSKQPATISPQRAEVIYRRLALAVGQAAS
ncbi:MAG TPA: nuclease-related domain-containing protein [Solirubrobacterales bacterium]|nr:nuclease-related domain-containing protein [Solirubrobacterales bacterium]